MASTDQFGERCFSVQQGNQRREGACKNDAGQLHNRPRRPISLVGIVGEQITFAPKMWWFGEVRTNAFTIVQGDPCLSVRCLAGRIIGRHPHRLLHLLDTVQQLLGYRNRPIPNSHALFVEFDEPAIVQAGQV